MKFASSLCDLFNTSPETPLPKVAQFGSRPVRYDALVGHLIINIATKSRFIVKFVAVL